MDKWRKVVVLLLLATAASCTPLINKLEPGKDFPAKHSVKQPGDLETEANNPTTEVVAPIELTAYKPTEVVAPIELTASNPTTEVIALTTFESDGEDATEIGEPAEIRSAQEEKTASAKIDYTGAQVWRVSTNKTGVRPILARLRRRNLISAWGGNHSAIDILVKPNAVTNVTRVFKRENISYEVIIEDLQKMINDENPPLDEAEQQLQDRRARAYNFWRYRANRRRLGLVGAYMGYNSLNVPMEYWPNANWGHRMTWKQYHRVEDIYGFLDYLAKTYPSIVTVKTIGKSYEGREIKMLRLSNGQNGNKAIFIDGGIHAREWISPATVTYFINQFAENFDEESEDIKNIDWYFVPVVNPDGYEYTHVNDRLWRKNRKPGGVSRFCFGTDLNRNFGYRWGGKGASSNPCSEIFRGARAFSEPEAKAISDFIKKSGANFTSYLTYHSYGQYLLYPWGYDNAVPPDHKDLQIVGEKVAEAIKQSGGSQYSVGSSSGLLYPASGGSDDWAKAQGIKYSYTIELSDTGRHGFVLPTSYIEPVARENLAGLRVIAHQVNKEF